jgi:AraC-like DNA-binding protein
MTPVTEFLVDKAWRFMLRDFGISTDVVLKRAQLSGDLFARKNATLSTEEYFRLWKSLEKSLGDPSFPLRLGQTIPAEAFNPPLFAALCSPNLYVAMERLSKYKRLIGPMTLAVEAGERSTAVILDCLYTDNPLPESLIATELVFILYLARLATREHIVPQSVSSTGALLTAGAYAGYFGVMPARGGANQIRFSAEDMERPFLTENEALWRFFEPELRKRLFESESGTDFSARVRSCLFELVPSGLCSSEEVAKRLAVSKRTLQRHLNHEKTSFQQELKKTREELARHYLENSTLSGAQISFLLGFEDPNSFVRAYRSWTGKTPGRVRAEIAP